MIVQRYWYGASSSLSGAILNMRLYLFYRFWNCFRQMNHWYMYCITKLMNCHVHAYACFWSQRALTSLQLIVRKQTTGCLGTKWKLEVEQNACWRLKRMIKRRHSESAWRPSLIHERSSASKQCCTAIRQSCTPVCLYWDVAPLRTQVSSLPKSCSLPSTGLRSGLLAGHRAGAMKSAVKQLHGLTLIASTQCHFHTSDCSISYVAQSTRCNDDGDGDCC